jgi:teichuronic acid biosynthesis glycosyltransferase TuaH
LKIALIGPNSLASAASDRLGSQSNVFILGARPYAEIPRYLQHADVLIVPHVVSAFTESLDPIKAYECLAVPTPTVATPVAGFREFDGRIEIAGGPEFTARVAQVLVAPKRHSPGPALPSWDDRAEALSKVLSRAIARRATPCRA